jgi:uncharacterized protein YeaO (DUF488 family)
MKLRVKRIYEPPAASDGFRVLVDRLWPRGVSKAEAELDLWLREAAPSTELRRWFHANPDQWDELQRRYRQELAAEPSRLDPLLEKLAADETVTLLYAGRDTVHNNAVVLAEVLAERSRKH